MRNMRATEPSSKHQQTLSILLVSGLQTDIQENTTPPTIQDRLYSPAKLYFSLTKLCLQLSTSEKLEPTVAVLEVYLGQAITLSCAMTKSLHGMQRRRFCIMYYPVKFDDRYS